MRFNCQLEDTRQSDIKKLTDCDVCDERMRTWTRNGGISPGEADKHAYVRRQLINNQNSLLSLNGYTIHYEPVTKTNCPNKKRLAHLASILHRSDPDAVRGHNIVEFVHCARMVGQNQKEWDYGASEVICTHCTDVREMLEIDTDR
jgi:hypothetical protein